MVIICNTCLNIHRLCMFTTEFYWFRIISRTNRLFPSTTSTNRSLSQRCVVFFYVKTVLLVMPIIQMNFGLQMFKLTIWGITSTEFISYREKQCQKIQDQNVSLGKVKNAWRLLQLLLYNFSLSLAHFINISVYCSRAFIFHSSVSEFPLIEASCCHSEL